MRGFCTLAVGDIKYYEMAYHLLKSYKKFTDENIPFAIYCDRENEFTREFDQVYILEEYTCSYLDKINLLNHPQFDENIFIDADCLCMDDINWFWKYFSGSKGLTFVGNALDLDDENGWFLLNDVGDYAEEIKFIPQFHGGIFYFRNDDTLKKIYKNALIIAKNYHEYKFKYFENPADEPILALATAVQGSKPINIDSEKEMFVFYPAVDKVRFKDDRCYFRKNRDDEWKQAAIAHFQNCNTRKPLYLNQIVRNEHSGNNIYSALVLRNIKYGFQLTNMFGKKVIKRIGRVLNK